MLERPEVDRSNSLKLIAKECLAELKRLLENFENNPEEILIACQQLAIDLGTLIEQVKGEDRESTKAVISELEKFCEALYQCSQSMERVNAGSDSDYSGSTVSHGFVYGELLSGALGKVCEVIEKHIIQRKEVLFLPIGYKEWKGFETAYKGYLDTPGIDVSNEITRKDGENINISEYDIYIVPLPLLAKDSLGQAEVSEEKLREGLQIDQYSGNIVLND